MSDPPITSIPDNWHDDRLCCYHKDDGTSCGAYRMKGSAYCFQHDPGKEQERTEARSRGGKTSQCEGTSDWVDRDLGNMQEISDLVVETINRMMKGEIHPKQANAIVALINLLLVVYEKNRWEMRYVK